MRSVIRVLALAGLMTSQAVAQNVQRDVLAGRITGRNGPVAGATITVLPVGAPPGTFGLTARTDAEGRWLLAVQEGTGSYTVRVRAIGMLARDTVASRTESNKPILVDLRMENVQMLDAVRIVAEKRARPPRQDVAQDRAGSDRATDGFPGAIAVGDQGNLAAMAASVPGVSLVPDAGGGVSGFSVLGLSPDQNRITLNGMSFGGGEIPRDAFVMTRVASTSYDVSRGGFSGGQLSLTAASGSNFHTRLAHFTLDSRALQSSDPIGRRLGAPYSNTQVSAALSGPIVLDKLFYNASVQIGRRSSDLVSLNTADGFLLDRAGLAADSASRLFAVMSAKGLPLTTLRSPDDRLTDNMSVLSRLDWVPSPTKVGNVVVSARRNVSRGTLLGSTTSLMHGGDVTTTGADITGTFSSYLPNNALNDLRIGARVNSSHTRPYADLPDVRINVTSALDDSTLANTTLFLGSNAMLPRGSNTLGVQAYDMLSWFSVDRRHRFRATTDLRFDRFSQEQHPNLRGTYAFNSIADFEADRPSSFTRAFVSQSATVRAVTGSMSFGDEWRPGERTQYMYGLRADANAIIDRSDRNDSVLSRFGARTDFVPRAIDISPRVGFFKAFGTNGTSGIPGFGAPFGNVRGGIGLFRNDIPTSLAAPGQLATGLPTGLRDLRCIGSAIPAPDWDAFRQSASAVPTGCADTSVASPFAESRPNVWLIDRGFAAQRSWRANLAVNSFLIPKRVRFTLEGVYSLNLHQQSPTDLNFTPTTRFTLEEEAGRPVYVEPSNIVPTSGAMTLRDSRVDANFGSVTALKSDLHSTTRQLIATIFPAPGDALGRFTQWQASYALQRMNEESRGFAGTTAADPLAITTTRGTFDVRHQVTLSFATRVGSLFSINTTARFASGTPFTPVVSGDINGDGLANDRAFVFDPASGNGVAGDMAALMAGSSRRVRECLREQIGRIAARNSCEGPWTATMNAMLVLNPEKLGMQNRTQLSLSVTNVPAGLDALLHGSSHLRGWGQSTVGDPTLLRVQGFDPATQQFAYEVNQRFGDMRVSRNGVRNPFVVTLEARIMLGRDYTRQAIDQTLGPGRTQKGNRLTVAELKQRLLTSVYNPVRGLLQAKDSLTILTNDQFKALVTLDRTVTAKQDSIVTPVAQYLASLPASYSEQEVLSRVLVMMNQLFDVVVEGMRAARDVFTAEQINEFPPLLRSSFDIQRLLSARPTAGFDPAW